MAGSCLLYHWRGGVCDFYDDRFGAEKRSGRFPLSVLVLGAGGLVALLVMGAAVMVTKEYEKKKGRLDRTSVSSIENVSIADVKTQVAAGFEQTEQGYFLTKNFSFARNKITYVIRFSGMADDACFSDVLDSEYENFDHMPELLKGRGVFCCLFFFEKAQVCKEEKTALREATSSFMALESAMPSAMKAFALPLLYESTTEKLVGLH